MFKLSFLVGKGTFEKMCRSFDALLWMGLFERRLSAFVVVLLLALWSFEDGVTLFDCLPAPFFWDFIKTAVEERAATSNPGKAHDAPLYDSETHDSLDEIRRAGRGVATLPRA